MAGLEKLGEGLWRWTACHPEWHPRTAFGAEIACYAMRVGPDTLLVDPLVDEATEDAIDAVVTGGLTIAITLPYHVRSAERLWRRHRGRRPTEVLGHPACARRLGRGVALRTMAAGDELPHGCSAHAIGSPRRQELPLHVPEHDALLFGDAVVGVDGALRVWSQRPLDERRRRWHRERLVPTLEPLLELEPERILVTHGRPVLGDGTEALRAALQAPPWYHRPS